MRPGVRWGLWLALAPAANAGCASVTSLGHASLASDRPIVVQVIGSNTGLSLGLPSGPTLSVGRQHFVATYVRTTAGPDVVTRLTLGDLERIDGNVGTENTAGLRADLTLELEIVPTVRDTEHAGE